MSQFSFLDKKNGYKKFSLASGAQQGHARRKVQRELNFIESYPLNFIKSMLSLV